MASQKIPFVVSGRMVWGDLYKGNPLDADGNQKIWKSGVDQGKPRATFDFGLAVRKTPGVTHWSQEPWGAEIWKAGHAGVPNANVIPTFSWKVKDGDDATLPPIQVGKPQGKPLNQRPGHAGHWILSLSSSYAPNLYDGLNNLVPLTAPGVVLPGDLLQVKVSAEYNGSPNKPGTYLNHEMVVFSGHSREGRIATGGQDPHAAGFKLGLAEGGVESPVGGALTQPPAAAPAAPGNTPPPPGAAVAPPAPAAAAAPAAPATAVTPNASFAPPPPGAAAAPAAPPAAPVRQMLPAAGNTPYDEWIKAGWTDAQLVAHGKMAQ